MADSTEIISFLQERLEDSTYFTQNGPVYDTCRRMLQNMEQSILGDKASIRKLRKSLKNLISTGKLYSQHQQELGVALEELFSNNKLVSDSLELQDSELGFVRLGVLMREVAKLQESMLFFATSTLLPLLDSMLETFRDIKQDKSVERAHRLVESKSLSQCDDELSNSQKLLLCSMCEAVVKMHNASLRRANVLPLAFCDFFDRFRKTTRENLELFDEFEAFMKRTRVSCQKLKSVYTAEKERANLLRKGAGVTRNRTAEVYEMEKPERVESGLTNLTDYLMKKSEGLGRWSRRLCAVRGGHFLVHHSAEAKKPVVLDLVACELKVSGGDRQFRVFYGGSSRVYSFKARDDERLNKWVLVFNNAKSRALQEAFGADGWRLVDRRCADCGAEARDWVSLNLGVVLCVKCCGIHREMGVHVSRTCSVSLDCVGPCHLLILGAVGNDLLNSVLLGNVTQTPIGPSSSMDDRREFIFAKYVHKAFVVPHTDPTTWMAKLRSSIREGSVVGVLEIYAEDYPLMVNFDESSSTALNNSLVYSVSIGDSSESLAIVDLIAQNIKTDLLEESFSDYDSVFHYALMHSHLKSLQILLKAYPRAIERWRLVELANSLGNGVALKLFNGVKYRDASVVNDFVRSCDSESLSSGGAI